MSELEDEGLIAIETMQHLEGKGKKRKAQAFPSLGTSFAFLSLPTGRCCGLGCIQALI